MSALFRAVESRLTGLAQGQRPSRVGPLTKNGVGAQVRSGPTAPPFKVNAALDDISIALHLSRQHYAALWDLFPLAGCAPLRPLIERSLVNVPKARRDIEIDARGRDGHFKRSRDCPL